MGNGGTTEAAEVPSDSPLLLLLPLLRVQTPAPARRAVRGRPSPLTTPGQELAPLEPQFDAIVCRIVIVDALWWAERGYDEEMPYRPGSATSVAARKNTPPLSRAREKGWSEGLLSPFKRASSS